MHPSTSSTRVHHQEQAQVFSEGVKTPSSSGKEREKESRLRPGTYSPSPSLSPTYDTMMESFRKVAQRVGGGGGVNPTTTTAFFPIPIYFPSS